MSSGVFTMKGSATVTPSIGGEQWEVDDNGKLKVKP